MTILLSISFISVAVVFTRVYLFFANKSKPTGSNTDKISFNSINNETQTSTTWSWKKKSKKPGKKSIKDSDGFFNSIPDADWKQIKEETKNIINIQDGITQRTSYLLSESGANIDSDSWWIDNWKINFNGCQNKMYIGGKWLCDPQRVVSIADELYESNKPKRKKRGVTQQKECIIYISGVVNEIDFADQFLDYSMARMSELHSSDEEESIDLVACELHIFAPHGQEKTTRDGIFIHDWGFRPSNKESMGVAGASFKTLQQTITELGHAGRISMLVVDCEGCEWDLYPDILSLADHVKQVLLQMHGTPFMTNDLFLAMQQNGYLIYHRAASGYAEIHDYSFIKMEPNFYNWKD